MAWLLHPDDFDELFQRCTPSSQPLPPGAVAVSPCSVIARGHLMDQEHPELGAPTFAEYGEAHAKILEAERVRFQQSLAIIEKHMAPMPRWAWNPRAI